MPNNTQAARRVKTSATANSRNKPKRSALRTAIKQMVSAIDQGDSNISEKFQKIQKMLAQCASRGILHKKTARRYTSRLNARAKTARG